METPTHQNPARNTVAIMGDSPVICHAIARLVESGGYETRIVDSAHEGTPLADVDIVLITAGTNPRLGPMWWADTVPVLRLVDTSEEEEALEGRGILWPCTAKDLQDSVCSAINPDASGRPL